MLHCVIAFTCFCTFCAIPTSLLFVERFLLILVSVHFYGVQVAHAKFQPQDIGAGIILYRTLVLELVSTFPP